MEDTSTGTGIFVSEEDDICSLGTWHRSDQHKVIRTDMGTYSVILSEDKFQVSLKEDDSPNKYCATLDGYDYVQYDADEHYSSPRGTFSMTKPMSGTFTVYQDPLLSVFRRGPAEGRHVLYNTAYRWTNSAGEDVGMDFVRHDRGYDRLWADTVDTSTAIAPEWRDTTVAGCGATYDSAPANLTGPFDCSAHLDGPDFDLSETRSSYVGTIYGTDAEGNSYELYQALHINHDKHMMRYDSGEIGKPGHSYTVWAFENEGFSVRPLEGCKRHAGLTYEKTMENYSPKRMQWMGEGTITSYTPAAAQGKKVNMFAGVAPAKDGFPDWYNFVTQGIMYTDADTGEFLGHDVDLTSLLGSGKIWWSDISSTNPDGIFDLHDMCNGTSKALASRVNLLLLVVALLMIWL